MNTRNALIFCLIGGAMMAMSPLFAARFSMAGFDSMSTRALWLAVVGGSQVAMGTGWFGQKALSWLGDRLATFGVATLDRSRAAGRAQEQVHGRTA